MKIPACPHCRQTNAVALLSRVEQRGLAARTWICRQCLSSFGNVEEWRRQLNQIRNRGLLRGGVGIAAAIGVSVLILRRKSRQSLRSRRQAELEPHAAAFV